MTDTLDDVRVVKIYPQTPLRGAVTVWFSGDMREGKRYPKFHLDRRCEGLERVSPGSLRNARYDDAFAVGEEQDGRPCRICCLERVLYTVLRLRAVGNRGSRTVFATFTSQPCPTARDQRLDRYRWRVSSDSGRDRLRRIAAALNLPAVTAEPGPVCFGMLPERGARILARNLRTEIRTDLTTPPEGWVIETVWALLGDNPPQLARTDEVDPWEAAFALAY
jgi:hypothetical protein